MIKLVITDLDDTLYSWIGFFVPAFYDMVKEVAVLTDVSEKELLKEYKEIHQKSGSVEYPFATLQLPAVRKKFVGMSDGQIKTELNTAFHRFNSTRKKLLKLYPGVEETLKLLYENKILIVAYTESAEENGFYRLKKLGIDHFFTDVYVSDSTYEYSDGMLSSPKTHVVHGKKPNAMVLKEICSKENVTVPETIYIGDSLSKDMLMAKQAGMRCIWCNFPKDDMKELYDKLVCISHWTEKDFQSEQQYKGEWVKMRYEPDYTIHSFEECKKIFQNILEIERIDHDKNNEV